MRTCLLIYFLITFTACHVDVKVKRNYELYFDGQTYQTFQKGLEAYQKNDYKNADSLLTLVINKSKDNLSIAMPIEFNPYYYRGHNSFELEKYEQSIKDFDHVVSDTTTNTDILIVKTEAFKMLQQYDTAISLCNRLLKLNIDSSIIFEQTGVCYFQKGIMENACADFMLSKKLAKGDTPQLDKFLKNCK